MNWSMKRLYKLLLKEGWRVKHVECLRDNIYYVELTNEINEYFPALLVPCQGSKNE